MAPATQADIQRLHDKLEPMAIDVAVIKSKIENLPSPRPCDYFKGLKQDVDDHLADSKAATKTWRAVVIKKLVDIAVMILVVLAAFFISTYVGGCTNYKARIEVPVLSPDGLTVVDTKVYTMDMTYWLQDKTIKSFTIDPLTGRLTFENFGSETSQVVEKLLEKMP